MLQQILTQARSINNAHEATRPPSLRRPQAQLCLLLELRLRERAWTVAQRPLGARVDVELLVETT
eukprot:UN10047